MRLHKKGLMAAAACGALISAAVAAAPAKAATDVIITDSAYGSFAGGAESGTGPYGVTWAWDKTFGPASATSPGAGYSAWGTPGLGYGEDVYENPVAATDFQVSFVNFSGLTIDSTPSTSSGGYTELTRMTADGVAWTPVINGQTVTFYAPTGVTLSAGEDYFINVVFDSKTLSGANTSFTAAFSTAVPEASTWAMLLLGFAGLGFFGYRKSSYSRSAIA